MQGAVVFPWVDLALPATGSIGAYPAARYSCPTACAGQLHVSGIDYQLDGEGWADTRHSYSHQGGGGTKVNLLPYPNLLAYDFLHTFHRLPCRCVLCPQLPTAVSTTSRANRHLHGRCHDNIGAVVAVAGTDAAVAAAGIVAAVVAAVAVVGAAADVADADADAVDAAAPAVAPAVVVSVFACLHSVRPCRVHLGLLFRHSRCPGHPSRQQKGRILFRLSSPSPSPFPSRHMRSAQHLQEPSDSTLS